MIKFGFGVFLPILFLSFNVHAGTLISLSDAKNIAINLVQDSVRSVKGRPLDARSKKAILKNSHVLIVHPKGEPESKGYGVIVRNEDSAFLIPNSGKPKDFVRIYNRFAKFEKFKLKTKDEFEMYLGSVFLLYVFDVSRVNCEASKSKGIMNCKVTEALTNEDLLVKVKNNGLMKVSKN